jgi:hypothetical protein
MSEIFGAIMQGVKIGLEKTAKKQAEKDGKEKKDKEKDKEKTEDEKREEDRKREEEEDKLIEGDEPPGMCFCSCSLPCGGCRCCCYDCWCCCFPVAIACSLTCFFLPCRVVRCVQSRQWAVR